MQKRTVLVFLICAGLFGLWLFVNSRLNPPVQQSATSAPKDGSAPADPGAKKEEVAPVQPIVVVSPGTYEATLSGKGIHHFRMGQYGTKNQHKLVYDADKQNGRVDEGAGDQPMEMVPTYQPSLTMMFPNSSFALPAQESWQLDTSLQPGCVAESADRFVVPEGGCVLGYRMTLDNKIELQKIYRFYRSIHQMDVVFKVLNGGADRAELYASVGLSGFQDPKQKSGIFSEKHPQNELLWDQGGTLRKISFEDAKNGTPLSDNVGAIRWFGIGSQYFIQSVGMPSSDTQGNRKIAVSADGTGALGIRVEYAQQSLKPGQKLEYPFVYYAGPKIPERLKNVSIAGQPVGLESAIEYTLGVIARPLLWVLRQIYQVIHSWALAIVLLTLLVKLITLYPSYRSTQSMKSMSNLKPQLDALKQKYGDDKQKFNQEVMQLYRKNGVNPLGGCLPMLLQMPIYFALYSMLGNAVELYRVPLISGLHGRWIQDLTASDPYFILPLLTGVFMFFQTKMTPSPSADTQQKMMMWMMPIMFTVLGIFMPAGLSLYILTNTVLGIIQQVVTNRFQKSTTRKS